MSWVLILVFKYACMGNCVAITSQQITGFSTYEACKEAASESSAYTKECIRVK